MIGAEEIQKVTQSLIEMLDNAADTSESRAKLCEIIGVDYNMLSLLEARARENGAQEVLVVGALIGILCARNEWLTV